MKKTRFDLAEMSRTDLLEYAEVHGVKLLPKDTTGTIIDKILGEVSQTEEAVQEAPTRKKLPDLPDVPLGALYSLDGKRVEARRWKLKIFESDTEKGPVDIVVNGYNIRVPRGKEVTVLEPYIDVLKEAVVNTITKDPDTGIETPRSIPQFAFQATPE